MNQNLSIANAPFLGPVTKSKVFHDLINKFLTSWRIIERISFSHFCWLRLRKITYSNFHEYSKFIFKLWSQWSLKLYFWTSQQWVYWNSQHGAVSWRLLFGDFIRLVFLFVLIIGPPPSPSCVGTTGTMTWSLHLTRPCCVALGRFLIWVMSPDWVEELYKHHLDT